jgi:phosphate transport system protein
MTSTHTDRAYEAELKALRDRLLEMGGLVEEAVGASVRSLVERESRSWWISSAWAISP